MTSETTRYETYQKDSYNFSFGMIGGRKNKQNHSPGHGKPSKPGRKPRKHRKPSPQGGGTRYNNNHDNDDDDDDDGDDNNNNNNHHGQSQPPQQGVPFQPAPGGYACAYAAPYPYQFHPPSYPNQVAVGGYHGDYHAPGYPGSFVPHQGGYGNHGGGHMKDVGLVGAAIGVASFGMFKLLRERRRYGRG